MHGLAHPLASDDVQCIQVVEHVIQHMDIQSVKNHATSLHLLLLLLDALKLTIEGT